MGLSLFQIYYLNPKDLTDGEPPNDRGCRICKSIGHKERMCPEKKKIIRVRRNKKKQDVPGKQDVKKDVSVRKPPLKPKSGDEEDEDDEDNDDGDSESDKGSSDFDDEVKDTMRPFKRPIQKMPEATLDSKQLVYNTTSTEQGPKGLPAEGSYKIPGFINPDLKNNPQPHFRPFLVTVPQNTQTHSPKIPNIQNMPVNANPPMAHTNQMLERAHTQLPNCSDKICIPTIVFKNSNLASEPVCSPINPITFPISPEQEPLRPPPPGFIPLPQNGQPFPNTIHFPPDQKAAIIQNSWKFEGPPAYVTNPNVEILRTMPIPPAFNNLRFTGMLAPAEQLIWGQAPTLPATHQHTLNAAVAKLQLSNVSNTEEKPQGDVSPVSQDVPKKENHLNSSRNKPIKGIFPDSSS